MINIKQIPEFNKAASLIEKIEKEGYEAYFVGGGVRDTLLHLPISDVDIASSATPEEIKRFFPVTFDVGIQHGTVMVLHEKETYEITTFRTESKYEKFRRPEKVDYVRSLEEDLKRRDFTINAIALNRNGQLVDPFDGQIDIKNKLIRAVGNPSERFREDALRMMRAARFMSQLGFDIEEKTKEAVEYYHPLLSKIAVERIREEWTKLLIGRNRKGGVKFFIETRLFQMCPGFQNRSEDLVDLALFPHQFQTPLIAWTVLLYFLKIDEEEVSSFLRAWKLSNKEISNVRTALYALRVRMEHFWDNHLLFATGIKIALEIEDIIAGFGVVNDINRLLALDKTLPIHSTHDIQINGNEVIHLLGFNRGGPYLGTILEDVKDRILSGSLPNNKKQIETFILKRRFIYLDEVKKKEYIVEEGDSARSIELGETGVLSSPSLLSFMEESCKEMIEGLVEEDETSVGTFVSMNHHYLTEVGSKIIIETRIKELSGKKYSFSIVARNGDDIVAIGEHTRKIINKNEFRNKLTK
ncbi:MAG TPA: CCA tRNA nucleotidyltransferase [Candidatus Jeotgalibaca pullicola]|nr:CCA tRNA nucleotidyltransferase [Candidatus Jeotgalibaca pullicola]